MKSILKKVAGIILTITLIFGILSCSNTSNDDSVLPSEKRIPQGFVKVTGPDVGIFYIAKTELTYAEWYEVYQWAVQNGYVFQDLGREGNSGKDGAVPTANSGQPVTYVSWRDAVVWCNAASEKEGLTPVYEYEGSVLKEAENYLISYEYTDYGVYYISGIWGTNTANTTNASSGCGKAEKVTVKAGADGYRLPTETEWEYAAKGGADYTYSGSDDIDKVAWYSGNSKNKTHDAATKDANGYGLYDMSGNVWEWCWDTYFNSTSRVLRGGSLSYHAESCAVSYRNKYEPCFQDYNIGFRVVKSCAE